MNWDAIGALGEVIGATAVVATLIYLSIQTRQNTKAVQHASSRGVMEDANAWRYRIVEDPDVAELFRTGLSDPNALSANDKYRFRMLLDALVFHWQHAVEAGQELPQANITRTLGTPRERSLAAAGPGWSSPRSGTSRAPPPVPRGRSRSAAARPGRGAEAAGP